MVDERLDDGVRIAQLLASEIDGDEGRLRDLAVTDADPDVEPTTDGALAYAIEATVGSDATALAEVYVQPDRVRVEFLATPEEAAEAAAEQDLRVRPKAVRPPRTLVFVEDGAHVKWILPVFERVHEAVSE